MYYSIVEKKSLSKNKKSLLCCLFLVYFVWYAISPLSLAFTVKKMAGDAAASYSGLRILLLEIIYDKLDEKNAADQGNSAARVLISEARVILPENIYLRFLPLRHLVLHEDSH